MRPRNLSPEECKAILSKGRYGRLALCSDNQPYIVPMSYVFSRDKIFLHSRGKGKKVEFVGQNPSVCFEIDSLEAKSWLSVIAYGTASLSYDLEAKERIFDAFVEKDLKGHGGKQFSREELEKMDMIIWEIEIDEMTGREGVW